MTQATDLLASPTTPPARPRSSWLLRGLFALLALALLAVAAAVLLLVSTVFLQRTDTRPPAQTFDQHNAAVVLPFQEPSPDPAEAATVWDGHGPVNILLLGVDQVDCKYGDDQPNTSTRTDTMVLVRVDPASRRVAMLSIPRDLLVSIPGYGAMKINTAHVWGERDDYEPGGGPGLLKEVIWENLGLQVHRFVRIDLGGFDRVLEIVGGLDMDLPPSPNDPDVALHDVHFPDGRCGLMTVHFKPGPQHLSPAEVMQYARSRYSTSDFDRNRRQQEVLLALKDRLLSPDMVVQAPRLLKEVLETVDSDFTTREIAGLATMALGLKSSGVVRLQIDDNVIYSDTYNEQSVLRLKPAEAQEVIRRFQAFEPPPTPTPRPTRDPNAPAPRRRPTAEASPAAPAEGGEQAPAEGGEQAPAEGGEQAPPPGEAAPPGNGGEPTPEGGPPPAP